MKFGTMHLKFCKTFFFQNFLFTCCKIEFVQCGKNPLEPLPSLGGSEAIFRDWREVAWELPGRSEQQCKERYRLAQSVVELTFVFLRVIPCIEATVN
jgi:hypothetical protein